MPWFRRRLFEAVVRPAKSGALDRALAEAAVSLEVARATVHAERSLLDDPSVLERLTDDAAAALATEARATPRTEGARWNVLLGDRLADVNNDLTHRMRGAFRDIGRSMEEAIETLRTAEEWDELFHPSAVRGGRRCREGTFAVEPNTAAARSATNSPI
ncbi:MAG: hypothetical protein H6514_15680 [Acidimicrobiaceae bacterium]|nr:hypothetical protein [Acidimicrobiaceae bacterium]